MRKKEAAYLFIFALSLVLFASAVSAQGFWNNLQDGAQTFTKAIADPLKQFTENTVAFVKTLFFILVFLIIATILSVIPLFQNRRGPALGVSLIISILAVYFIPTDLILPMLNPYTALGITLISIIPFILMFVFTQHMLTNTFLKKVAWMFFAIFLLAMTVYTAVLQGTDPAKYGSWWGSAVYGGASVLALIMVFFNEWIDRKLWTGKMEEQYTDAQKRMRQRIALDTLKEEEAEAEGIPGGRPRTRRGPPSV